MLEDWIVGMMEGGWVQGLTATVEYPMFLLSAVFPFALFPFSSLPVILEGALAVVDTNRV